MSQYFLKTILVGSTLLAVSCGTDHVSFRSPTPDQAHSVSESEITEVPEGLNLTAGELQSLQTRLLELKRFVYKTARPRIKEVNDICTSINTRINALKSDLAAAGSEAVQLDQKRTGLIVALKRRNSELNQNRTQLANLQGKVDALEAALKAHGPNLKKQLAQINRDFSNQITAQNKELSQVRTEIEEVLSQLPFNLDRYLELESKESEISVKIMILEQTLSEQTNIIMATAAKSQSSLVKEIAAAKKELTTKSPSLNARITALKSAAWSIRKQIMSVESEIQNNKVASALALPALPAECAALLK